jgi:pSer/pThr/pTyr-binding forkhead associated (FHA) protein
MQDSFQPHSFSQSRSVSENAAPLPTSHDMHQLPLKLKQINGSYPGRIYSIQGRITPEGTTRIIIGRSVSGHDAGVSINEPVVSRKHAELIFDGETLAIRHLSEKNPTYVNKEPLNPGDTKFLKINDMITLADIQFELLV